MAFTISKIFYRDRLTVNPSNITKIYSDAKHSWSTTASPWQLIKLHNLLLNTICQWSKQSFSRAKSESRATSARSTRIWQDAPCREKISKAMVQFSQLSLNKYREYRTGLSSNYCFVLCGKGRESFLVTVNFMGYPYFGPGNAVGQANSSHRRNTHHCTKWG